MRIDSYSEEGIIDSNLDRQPFSKLISILRYRIMIMLFKHFKQFRYF